MSEASYLRSLGFERVPCTGEVKCPECRLGRTEYGECQWCGGEGVIEDPDAQWAKDEARAALTAIGAPVSEAAIGNFGRSLRRVGRGL